jgi:hypothetical protein
MDMFIDRILEDVLQSFHAMESFLRAMFGSKLVQFIVKVTVHGKGNLEEIQSVGINAFERVLLLILDYFLEGADVLGIFDLDGEDATGVIAEH